MLIALESTGLHFYPRPPRGGRRARPAPTRTSMVFLSTPSARRATLIAKHGSPSKGDFYPRPPRGGRRNPQQGDTISKPISIHALREEGDCGVSELVRRAGNFYPRPPRGGRRSKKYSASGTWQFLSTPSARRATRRKGLTHGSKRISIHALREEGDPIASSNPPVWVISIHALREEGD